MPDPQKLMAMSGQAPRPQGPPPAARASVAQVAISLRRLMAVRIRLRRVGSKKNPSGASSSPINARPRDGRTIETIGQYNPQTEPSTIVFDEERARHWLEHGAQPSETVAGLLRTKGIAAHGS